MIIINKNGNTGIGLGNNVIPVNKLDIKGGVAIGKNFTPNGVTPGIVAPANGLMVEGRVGIGTTSPNNKVYIGRTNNFNQRMIQHKYNAKNGNKNSLYKKIKKEYIIPLINIKDF